MFRLYGIITQYGEINPALLFSMDSALDALRPRSLPYKFRRTIMDTPTLWSNILDAFVSSYNGKISAS